MPTFTLILSSSLSSDGLNKILYSRLLFAAIGFDSGEKQYSNKYNDQ
jgi:hypothetical protein